MSETEIYFATVSELGRMLRTNKVSAVELTRIFLARLEQRGPRYNALAELTPDLALIQAQRADRRLRQRRGGRAGGKERQPLLGIPYGAKDLLATKGIPTRWGAPPYRDQVPDHDATVVSKLREAGAVLIGKLAMVELAGGGGYAFASASLHGPGLNPWNLGHWSGGSSSGSGSAVAVGLVPFALGSETWGSIVSPSTYCGITGLRPTWGLVSRYGAMELAWSMDKVGPMARSAEDCGWVLEAIAGTDDRDRTVSRGFHFASRISRKGFRLGILPADFTGEPATEKAFEEALRVLRRAGMKLGKVKLPDHPYAETARTLLSGESAAAHEEFIKSEKINELVDEAQREGLKKNLQITAAEFLRAESKREAIIQDVLRAFGPFDAMVSPSLLVEASTIDTNLRETSSKRGGYAVLGALCGIPQLALPMGFGQHGLPLGLSIYGRPFSENTLLQIGMTYQRDTDWHRRTPPNST